MIRRYFLRFLALSPLAALAAPQSARGQIIATARPAGAATFSQRAPAIWKIASLQPADLKRLGVLTAEEWREYEAVPLADGPLIIEYIAAEQRFRFRGAAA